VRNPKQDFKITRKKINKKNRGGIHINKRTFIVVVVLVLGCSSGCIEEKSQPNYSDANITGGNMTEKDLIQINDITVRASWVQDANNSELIGIMENKVRTGPEGSGYLIGPSKNKNMDVGIYFYDPTATN